MVCQAEDRDCMALIGGPHLASAMRWERDSAEKPPKTTECTAPIRAHASMATAQRGPLLGQSIGQHQMQGCRIHFRENRARKGHGVMSCLLLGSSQTMGM